MGSGGQRAHRHPARSCGSSIPDPLGSSGAPALPIDSKGSLVDLTGTVRHLSEEAFVAIARDSSRCFVCGVHESTAEFNGEHVVPDWVLRRFALHGKRVTLPNLTEIAYGRYRLRCCKPCNSLLGREVEEPAARLFAGDFLSFASGLATECNCLLYQWLCLLFVKTHLKDRDLRAARDGRTCSQPLSAVYEWSRLHHIHAVARAAASKISIDPSVQGTIFVFEMASSPEQFDYVDTYDHSTVLVRIGPVGVVAILDDCGDAGCLLTQHLSGIEGPLASIQLREIAALAAYGNELLLTRPRFRTELHAGRTLFMKCTHPSSPRYGEVDRHVLGLHLKHFCAPRILRSSTPNKEEMISRLAKGELTFIYDDDGNFITQLPSTLVAGGDARRRGGSKRRT